MYSNKYTVFFAVGVTVAVAVTLALASSGLRGLQDANFARAQRIAILQTVMEVDTETLDRDYETFIAERVLDYQGNTVADVAAFDLNVLRESRKSPEDRLFPLYIYDGQGQTNYIVPIQGAGLWGPISAYLALDSDLTTVDGVIFSHEKETPGLGAEIATADFQNQFNGKQLFAGSGEFESIRVLKGSGNDTEDRPHEVDGLTGATMTTRGVTDMFREELSLYDNVFRGMNP